MESAYTFEKCKKKLSTYEYGICRGCAFRDSCPISKKYVEQKKHPVIVMTHTRLKMESMKLSKYNKWVNVDNQEYQRRLIVIDEKPPLVEISSLKLNDFDQFLLDVSFMELDIDNAMIEEYKEIINQLRDNTLALSGGGGRLEPLNPSFSFAFTAQWYQKYQGNDVELLKRVEHLIQNGGQVHQNQQHKIGITTNKVVKYDFNNYNVIILDGTSNIDMEYSSMEDGEILDVPKIKSFDKLTIYNDSTQTISKAKLLNSPDLLADIARNIKVLCETEQVLVLCYKSSGSTLRALLKDEIDNRVYINHYGNVKGSNEYSDCTSLFMVGITHKGDPYYINKYEAIHRNEVDTKTKTISNVRRFQDFTLEKIKLNDQLVETIQDIYRIKIRKNGNTSQIKVYIPTKDQVFIKLLEEYFEGATVEKWCINETYPKWYEQLRRIFLSNVVGQKISKAEIKAQLGLTGAAGKKYFQRLQKEQLFIELISRFGIRNLNNRTYIRETIGYSAASE